MEKPDSLLDPNPDSPEFGFKEKQAELALDPEMLQFSRKLFMGNAKFILSAVQESQLPNDKLLEVAFAGRSNVGKSSLINKLLNRQNIARTSKEPGRTQALNLFELELAHAPTQLRLVDMPGYGYAKVPKSMVEGWTKLIQNYLKGRVNLRRVILLIDARHGFKPKDVDVLTLLDIAGVSTRVVLTKCDKITKKEAERRFEEVTILIKKHPCALPDIITTSAEKNIGIDSLRLDIASLIV